MRGFDDRSTDEGLRSAGDPVPAWVTWAAARTIAVLTRLRDERVCWFLLTCAVAIYAGVALYITRETTFFVDEIDIFAKDRGFRLSALAAPLNGHLVFVERLIYAINFKLFGASWLPIRIAEVVGAALAVVIAYALARRRVGGAVALAGAILLLFLGSAWELNYVVSGIGNVYAVAAGLGALLALERRCARGDAVACALLIVAVCSFTLGVAFAVGALLLLLLQPRAKSRAWIALIPLALYSAWLGWIRLRYLPLNPGAQNLHLGNAMLIPSYCADEAAAVAGVIAGVNYPFASHGYFSVFTTDSAWGPVVALGAGFALVMRLRQRPGTPFLWAGLATLLLFWVALALGYGAGRSPSTVRYAYGGAVIVLVITAEAARAVRFSNRALVIIYAFAACALLTNVARLRDGARFYRAAALTVRADLTAIEIARDRVEPDFVNPGSQLQPVVAGPYLAAVDRNGSPAFTQAELERQPDGVRSSADLVLVRAERIAVAPSSSGLRLGPCRPIRALGPALSFPVGPRGVALIASASAEAGLRRFGSVASTPVGVMPAGRRVDLRIPADGSRRPWVLTLTPRPAALSVCRLG
jgi:hypothetical protein